MPERWRRWAAAAVTVALAAVIVAGVFAGDDGGDSRVDSLSARLRCPVCQSESVADSTSQTARDMRDLIEEQVAAGRSDAEIEEFFIARYGEWILLDPPARGRTLVLWLLPLVALGAGIAVIAGRRRRAGRAPVADPVATNEWRASARSDLEAIDAQVESGELDAATAERLRTVYEAEVEATSEALTGLEDSSPPTTRSRARFAVGAAVVVGGIALATFAVIKAVEPRGEGGFVTGGVTDAGQDLSEVSNEELETVVAANPGVVPMRLALARRYFEDGDYSAALPHYLAVLDAEQDPEALASLGWMAYSSGEPNTAAGYLERSLEVAPDYPQAKWFLANVRLYGLDDAAAAALLLEDVLAADGVPVEVRQEAKRMLAEASAGS